MARIGMMQGGTVGARVVRGHPAARAGVRGLIARVSAWMSVARTRRQLANADDRTLADLGISRSQAQFEATRPFWDVQRYR